MKTTWMDRTLLLCPHYTLCCTEREYRKVLKHLKCKQTTPFLLDGATATTHTFECGSQLTCVVCMPISKTRLLADQLALLAHEAVHVWQHARDNMGERCAGTEIEAYAIQRITQELFEDFLKRKKVRVSRTGAA